MLCNRKQEARSLRNSIKVGARAQPTQQAQSAPWLQPIYASSHEGQALISFSVNKWNNNCHPLPLSSTTLSVASAWLVSKWSVLSQDKIPSPISRCKLWYAPPLFLDWRICWKAWHPLRLFHCCTSLKWQSVHSVRLHNAHYQASQSSVST